SVQPQTLRTVPNPFASGATSRKDALESSLVRASTLPTQFSSNLVASTGRDSLPSIMRSERLSTPTFTDSDVDSNILISTLSTEVESFSISVTRLGHLHSRILVLASEPISNDPDDIDIKVFAENNRKSKIALLLRQVESLSFSIDSKLSDVKSRVRRLNNDRKIPLNKDDAVDFLVAKNKIVEKLMAVVEQVKETHLKFKIEYEKIAGSEAANNLPIRTSFSSERRSTSDYIEIEKIDKTVEGLKHMSKELESCLSMNNLASGSPAAFPSPKRNRRTQCSWASTKFLPNAGTIREKDIESQKEKDEFSSSPTQYVEYRDGVRVTGIRGSNLFINIARRFNNGEDGPRFGRPLIWISIVVVLMLVGIGSTFALLQTFVLK
ncbi:hypothetical protein HK096_010500, partial [Nowakowskiella sp. JEL0078]